MCFVVWIFQILSGLDLMNIETKIWMTPLAWLHSICGQSCSTLVSAMGWNPAGTVMHRSITMRTIRSIFGSGVNFTRQSWANVSSQLARKQTLSLKHGEKFQLKLREIAAGGVCPELLPHDIGPRLQIFPSVLWHSYSLIKSELPTCPD